MSTDLEHTAGEKVGGYDNLNCEGWTENWWRWLLKIEEMKNPLLKPPDPVTLDWYRAGQPNAIQDRNLKTSPYESVWFLAAAPYGAGTVRVHIPRGKWSILAAPYIAGASPAMYPSLDIDGCKKLVDQDVDGVEVWYATLDGTMLTGCTVKSVNEFCVDVPKSNPFGIPPGQQQEFNDIEMVQYGYWVWIKSLEPGDHLLHLYGKSKIYHLDVTYQLLVTGL
jgi:hypothetical protein